MATRRILLRHISRQNWGIGPARLQYSLFFLKILTGATGLFRGANIAQPRGMVLSELSLSVMPEKRTEVSQTLASLAALIRREKGCRRCEFFLEGENQSGFEFIEEWQSRAEFEEHMRSHVFGILLGLAPLLRQPLSMRIYTVASAEGMEAVRRARRRAEEN
jgi:quinol monooxygenase YgiN